MGVYSNTLLAPQIEAISPSDQVSAEQIYHLKIIKLVNTNIDNTVIITK